MRAPLRIPVAAVSTGAFASFLAFGSVGAAGCRTALLAPVLWGRRRPARRVVGFVALGGFVGMMLMLMVPALAGVEQLPNWVKVPPTIVTVQGLYTMVMALLVPDSAESSVDLSPTDLAFTLYGVMAFPPTVLFVLVMTATSLLA
ncbi:MAG TPA: hypothetical protein VFJ65_06970 [Solirubrobacterales bacterium]|nr:hypothetical protein [Solirubrobacterales bacterium]